MDFLNKAKSKLHEIEGDLSKATSGMSLNKGDSSAPRAADSTSSTPAVNTPATSVAPSVAAAPAVKLPLAVRKSLRDDWDSQRPELEKDISTRLGVPWTVPIDYATLWPYAEQDMAKQNPGKLLCDYTKGFIYQLDRFLGQHGEIGKAELNKVAYTHSIALAQTMDKKVSTCGCDIVQGAFRITFAEHRLAYNVDYACEKMAEAIDAAGQPDEPLRFLSRSDIATAWDKALPELQAEFQRILGTPVFTLVPNFESNAAALAKAKGVREDWRHTLGKFTLSYFEGARDRLKEKGFAEDEMMQEAFHEVVDTNELTLRVVEKFPTSVKSTYNGAVVEEGVLVMCTKPDSWASNVYDPLERIVDLL